MSSEGGSDAELLGATSANRGAGTRELLVVLAIAVTQASGAQVASFLVHAHSAAFLVWISTGFNALLLPIALAAARRDKARVALPPCTLRNAAVDAVLVAPFFVLWMGANYMYTEALVGLHPSLVSALFAFTPVLVALLSVPMLHRRLTALALLACCVAAAGVTLIAQPWRVADPAPGNHTGNHTGNHSEPDAGVEVTALAASAPAEIGPATAALCVIGASAAAALYKVLFRRWHGDAPTTRVLLVLGGIGLYSLTVGTALLLVLEPTAFATSSSAIVWLGICTRALLDLGFNFCIAWGISLIHPLFISVGTLLSTPLNVLCTFVLHHTVPQPVEWVGMAIVIFGFALLLLDERRGGGAPAGEGEGDGRFRGVNVSNHRGDVVVSRARTRSREADEGAGADGAARDDSIATSRAVAHVDARHGAQSSSGAEPSKL